jgi:DNA polymerase-3 subunit alpha
MGARSVIRDVGRALAVPYGEVDRIAKMVPFAVGMTLKKAVEMNHELRELVETDVRVTELMNYSKRLEGLPRHASTHAAGVVICDRPVSDYVPLSRNEDVITTQFPMNTIEELGLLKMDFLGLRYLTVIKHTVDEIKRSKGIDIDIDSIPWDDAKVYEMISHAKTEGVFQLESSGMKSFMRELEPGCLDDIIAGISLYRPGPMDSIPKYVKGKRNKNAINYPHEALIPILKETHGCIVYQEQVMEIVRRLAGYSWARADLVRRAMSKKKADVMENERKKFIHGDPELGVVGAVNNGVPVEVAARLFDDMSDFAGYGFNKSHAAGYAVVCYQTAWLKHHYPLEYMAALLTSCGGFTAKITEYIQECRQIGVKLAPPDINEGFAGFSVSKNKNAILFGLSAIKNVGGGAVQAIVRERGLNGRFMGITDFLARTDGEKINKRCVESLIRAGAFDSLGGRRSQYLAVFETLMSGMQEQKRRNIEGQMSLDSLFGEEEKKRSKKDELPNERELPLKHKLADEKAVLGIYVSGHPILEYEREYKPLVTKNSRDFMTVKPDEAEAGSIIVDAETEVNVRDGELVKVAGIIASKSVKYTKVNNEPMAFLTIEDETGVIEVIVFPKIYDRHSKLLNDGACIFVEGRASVREDEDAKIVCDSIRFLRGNVQNVKGEKLFLKIPKEMASPPYAEIRTLFNKHPGGNAILVYDERTKTRSDADGYLVDAESPALILTLKGLVGDGCVVVK